MLASPYMGPQIFHKLSFLHSCTGEPHAVPAHVRQQEKRLRRQAASEARQWQLPEAMRRVVLICFCCADGVAEAAVVYLEQQRRIHHWPQKSDIEMSAIVCDAVLAAPAEELLGLVDIDAPSDEVAMATAIRFVEDWRMSQWVLEHNEKGVAPPTAALLDEQQRRLATIPENVRPKLWGASADRVARMRASRWRQRWNAALGVMRCQEVLPVEVMRQKAVLISEFRNLG